MALDSRSVRPHVPRDSTEVDVASLDFDRLIKAADAARAPDVRLDVLRPAWINTHRLDIARRCVAACNASLHWVTAANAIATADLIHNSYLAFPEIELEFPQSRLADKVLLLAADGRALHESIVSHRIDPKHRGAREAVVLQLCRCGHYKTASTLLGPLLAGDGCDVLISRLLSEPGGGGVHILPLVQAISDHLIRPNSLAGLRLGKALSHILDDSRATIEPIALASAVSRLRSFVRSAKASGSTLQAEGREDVTDLLHRTLCKISASPIASPERSQRADKLVAIVSAKSSGVVSWFDQILDEDNVVFFPAKDFKSSGLREFDGSIAQIEHAKGDTLLFGPYITLQPGLFRVTFLGELPPHLPVAMAATTDWGATVLSASTAFLEEPGSTEIGALTFEVIEPKKSCEFVLRVQPGQGRVVVRGVTLRRLDRFTTLRAS